MKKLPYHSRFFPDGATYTPIVKRVSVMTEVVVHEELRLARSIVEKIGVLLSELENCSTTKHHPDDWRVRIGDEIDRLDDLCREGVRRVIHERNPMEITWEKP